MKIVRKKKISKLFRSKTWPFTVKSIVIYNMAGASVYCEINGSNYALNGFAQDKLKLPHVIDSEYMIVDKEATKANGGNKVVMSVSPIIEIGLGLFTEKEVDKLRKINRDIKILNNEIKKK